MFRSITINNLLRIAPSRQSIVVALRVYKNTNSSRTHNTFYHTSPPPGQHHDSPPVDIPQRGQPPSPISTINDAEISHFSRLSAQWWDERGEFALLHKMNPHRMRFIREKVLEVRREEQPDVAVAAPSLKPSCMLEGMDVLDVGCGGGILSEVPFVAFGPLTTRVSDLIDDPHRASLVLAQTRSLSTHQRRTSASRRATLRWTPASQRCHSGMRRLRGSCRSPSGSILSARWRSWNMWTTQLHF